MQIDIEADIENIMKILFHYENIISIIFSKNFPCF